MRNNLILTRFQPGDWLALSIFEPFQRFLILQPEGKPFKRFWEITPPLDHPVETG